MTDTPKPSPKPRGRGFPLGTLLCLLIAGGIVWGRYRSMHTADFGAFFTPGGKVQGVASYKGQVLFAFSTLSLGEERGLTVDGDALPVAEFDQMYGWVYGAVPGRTDFIGFGHAASRKGDLVIPEATHMTFAAPHWFLATLFGLPTLLLVRRGIRRWRRGRRGSCRECGYDLRGSGGTCPECGAGATSATTSSSVGALLQT